jgi:uncharacterized protein YndB with AHSA1/START domain
MMDGYKERFEMAPKSKPKPDDAEDASGTRGHETKVSVRFEPAPGGTRIVLVQQSFETRLARDNHHRGWSASYDRMARMVGA